MKPSGKTITYPARLRHTIRVGKSRTIVALDGEALPRGELRLELNTDGADCTCGARLLRDGLLLTEALGPLVECGNCGARYAVDTDEREGT